VQLRALLQGEGVVCVHEAQPIPTGLELGYSLLTVPVLVTADQMRVEAKELIRTLEIIHQLSGDCGCRSQHK
jgi:hypothetical protein